MGAINYKTNDFVTIGVNVNEFAEDGRELTENGFYYNIDDEISNLYEDITNILSKYNFYYNHVAIKSGYYEGFYIKFENNFDIFYNDYFEKMQAVKEITQLKNFLIECVENGLCVCFPSWCTSYLNVEESKKEIIKQMKSYKEHIKTIPTYQKYKFEF